MILINQENRDTIRRGVIYFTDMPSRKLLLTLSRLFQACLHLAQWNNYKSHSAQERHRTKPEEI